MSGYAAVEFVLACIGANTAGRWVRRRRNRPADEQEDR